MTTTTYEFDYDVFISYARKDGIDIAQRIHDSLRDNGLRVFLDQHQIQHGETWWRRITESIERSKLFVFVITEHSVTSSVCTDEWNIATGIPRPILTVKVVDDDGHIIADSDIPEHISRINYINATQAHLWNDIINEIAFHVTRYEYLYKLSKQIDRLISTNTANRFIDIIFQDKHEAKKKEEDLLMSRMLRSPSEPTQTFNSLDEAWEAYRGQILLLGQPGAGKSTTLLQYTQTLIKNYLTKPNQHVPIYASIAYWDSYRNNPLADWLTIQNKLSDDIVDVIQNGRAVLILDGLDELGSEKTEEIVVGKDEDGKEIKEERLFDPRQRFMAYVQQAIRDGNQVLMTCRVNDYNAIGEKLDIRGAIELQPLTDTQIETYLGDVPTVQTAVMSDDELLDICRFPLLLSLIAFGYRDATDDLKALPSMTEANDLRDAIFGQYMQASYDFEARRRELLGEEMPFTLEKVLDVLGHAAMINVADIKRDDHKDWGKRTNIIENILVHHDFTYQLEPEQVQSFLQFIPRLNVIEQLEDGTYRFLHLLIRDYLAFNFTLKSLRADELYRRRGFLGITRRISGYYTLSCLAELQDVRATDILLKRLEDDERNIRDAVIQCLGRISDTQAVPALIFALQKDSSANIRSSSATALGEISDTQAVPALIFALQKDSSANVRSSSATALGEINNSQSIPPLIEALKNRGNRIGSNVAKHAAEALEKIGTPEVTVALINSLQNSHHVARSSAAWLLGKIGNPQAITPLIKSLQNDSDSHVRSDSATALGDIGDPQAIPALINSLKTDSHDRVRFRQGHWVT